MISKIFDVKLILHQFFFFIFIFSPFYSKLLFKLNQKIHRPSWKIAREFNFAKIIIQWRYKLKNYVNFSLINNSFLYIFFFNPTILSINRSIVIQYLLNWISCFKKFFIICLRGYKSVLREGIIYIRALLCVFFTDAFMTDDEPLWEPVEWSLVLTWILFIFIFAWIAENLITSRFGSYTGRDKRVWFGWYKTFWLLEAWFALSYGSAAMFVIVPFYSELVYSITFLFSWWNWYSRVFFFKFLSLYSVLIIFSYYIQTNLKWYSWKKTLLFTASIIFFLSYLLYTHIVMVLFAYFSDPLWYQKTKYIDAIFLSHEPWKWGWGPVKRDHFSYHKVSTVFWFKTDGPYASASLIIHMFFTASLFLLYIYWLALFRRIFATKEVSVTFFVCCVSAFKQFFFHFFLLYGLIVISFLISYWRTPIEFLWLINNASIGAHFLDVCLNYISFLVNLF